MKALAAAKLPKKTTAKVDDADNPAWTENMLGAPVLKLGRGTRVNDGAKRAALKRAPPWCAENE
jgi:hypothetical protein